MLPEVCNPEFADVVALHSLPVKERVDGLVIDTDVNDSRSLVHIAAQSKQLEISITARRSLADAGEALSHRHFDVIFLEYWLGDETAVPFIHEIAAMQGPPCVVLTKFDEPDIRRIAFRAGAQAFLSKTSLGPQALESVTLTVLRTQLIAPLAAA
jgi:DNA-binding NarL/FixJ family response regulator